MNEKNLSDKEFYTEAINVEGIILQRATIRDIKDAKWDVIEEYPFAFPKSNGPILGKQGRIDIIALNRGVEIISIVECKKADEKYKSWLFFKKLPQTVKISPRFYEILYDKNNNSEFKLDIKSIGFPELDIKKSEYHLILSESREVKKNNWKSTTKRIEEACFQVSHGTRAIIDEIIIHRTFNKKFSQWTYMIVPIIVTTANLFICEFKDEDIDIDSGKIDYNKIDYKPVDWLIYEYPLLDYLQTRFKPVDNLLDTELLTKRHIFIVKSNYVKEFFEKMLNIVL